MGKIVDKFVSKELEKCPGDRRLCEGCSLWAKARSKTVRANLLEQPAKKGLVLNSSRTQIVIEMNHVDNASRLFEFLQDALKVGAYGGDLTLQYYGAATEGRKCIGHDVKALSVSHLLNDA